VSFFSTNYGLERKGLLITLLVLSSLLLRAQHDMISFKNGDQFMKETVINTNAVIQRGNNSLALGCSTSISQLFRVSKVSPVGSSFNVNTKKIASTVRLSGGEVQHYSSEDFDSNSVTGQAMRNIVAQTNFLQVDNFGVIFDIRQDPVSFQQDSLIAFLNLNPASFLPRSTLELITDTAFYSMNLPGSPLVDSATINGIKTVTRYNFDSRTDSTTSFSFTQTVTGSDANVNTNGVLVINNRAGMVSEKTSQSISVSYQLFNGVMYLVTRKSAVSERYRKL
jgi:hypothetical protein